MKSNSRRARRRPLLIHLNDKIIKRFWGKVLLGPPDDCWPWTSAQSSSGYGIIGFPPNGLAFAHRVAYTIFHGREPGELLVCHTCDNRLCQNPMHLFIGTHEDNMRDMCLKGRQGSRKTNWGKNGEHIGEGNGRSKLTETDIKDIRHRFVPGKKSKSSIELAHEYNVCRAHIYQIVKRKVWQHVP